MARKLSLVLVVLVLLSYFALNLIARNQARSMTDFVEAGVRTKKPEKLSFWEKVHTIAAGVTVPRPQNTRSPLDFGLEYQQVSYQSGSGHTLSAWLIDTQTPDPVVLLFHGYGASKDSLLPTAKALFRQKYSTMLVDFYGSGESSGKSTSIGVHEAKDVAASLEFAKTRWPNSKKIVYGFSMGGAAVFRAVAKEFSKPDAIVVESVFDKLVNAAGMRFRSIGLPPRPLADILLFWGGRTWGFDAMAHNPSDYARSIECPALLLFGDVDKRVGKKQAKAIYQNLRGSKKLVLIPGMGHQNAISVAPDIWQDEVATFLSTQRD